MRVNEPTSTNKMGGSRQVPGPLKMLLNIDVALTDKFCNLMNNFLPFRSLLVHYQILEVSCHGVAWFCGLLAFIWLFNYASLYQMQVNLFWGLVLDIIFVAVLKAFTRRRRPIKNQGDIFLSFNVDKFSFPSGHASRSAFICYFFCCLWAVPLLLRLPFIAWMTAVSLSRVLMRRHHLLDVGAGMFLGYIEGVIVGFLWLGQAQSRFFISFISDETQEGASYDI